MGKRRGGSGDGWETIRRLQSNRSNSECNLPWNPCLRQVLAQKIIFFVQHDLSCISEGCVEEAEVLVPVRKDSIGSSDPQHLYFATADIFWLKCSSNCIKFIRAAQSRHLCTCIQGRNGVCARLVQSKYSNLEDGLRRILSCLSDSRERVGASQRSGPVLELDFMQKLCEMDAEAL